jgi:hypothetical protein
MTSDGSASPMSSSQVWRWALPAPAVPAELILRLQKYRNLAQVPDAISDAAEEAARQARTLIAPDVVVWRGVASVEDESVLLGGTQKFQSRGLARLLACSGEAYVIVLTLGATLEERVHALFEEHLFLESVLLDTAAWAAIELLARTIRRGLGDIERRDGRSVTHRLGPGHLDWSVDEQPALLALFGGTPLPVSITEAACLLPQKSITGVLGIVPR